RLERGGHQGVGVVAPDVGLGLAVHGGEQERLHAVHAEHPAGGGAGLGDQILHLVEGARVRLVATPGGGLEEFVKAGVLEGGDNLRGDVAARVVAIGVGADKGQQGAGAIEQRDGVGRGGGLGPGLDCHGLKLSIGMFDGQRGRRPERRGKVRVLPVELKTWRRGGLSGRARNRAAERMHRPGKVTIIAPLNGGPHRSPRNDQLSTPPGPEGSNGSSDIMCRGGAGAGPSPFSAQPQRQTSSVRRRTLNPSQFTRIGKLTRDSSPGNPPYTGLKAGSARRSPGKRWSSPRIAFFITSRPRRLPMQWWGPLPKATMPRGLRRISKVMGSGNSVGPRSAAWMDAITGMSLNTGTPSISVSSVAKRTKVRMPGPWRRRHSSTALSIRSGCARSRSIWPGCLPSISRAPPMVAAVVPMPAEQMALIWPRSSPSVRASPWSRAVTSRLIMSLPGLSRRSATISSVMRITSPTAARNSSGKGSPGTNWVARAM